MQYLSCYWFISLHVVSSSSSMLLHMAGLPPFKGWIIFHCMFIQHVLSIYLLKDIWVNSIFWLLWIMLQWIWECRYLSKILISVLLDRYPEVGLLNYLVVLFFFWEKSILFSIVVVPFYQQHTSVPNSLHPCQHLSSFVFLFDNSNLNRSELISHDLICFSLVIMSDSKTHALLMLLHCLLLDLLEHFHNSPKWTSPSISFCALSQKASRPWSGSSHPPPNGQITLSSHYLNCWWLLFHLSRPLLCISDSRCKRKESHSGSHGLYYLPLQKKLRKHSCWALFLPLVGQ